MRTLAVIAACLSVVLSGCVPMAMFAQGGGSAYRGYHQRLGVYVASNQVNTLCLSPALRLAIWDFEGHFGKKVVMNSGYRTPWHNHDVGGASQSYHTKCMAADFFIPGVPTTELVAYARQSGMVGGLGCYSGQRFIHIDVRERPRGHKGPVSWGC